MSTIVNGKSLMKHHCLEKKNLKDIDMEDITDEGYMHAKRVCWDCEIKQLGDIMVYILKVMRFFFADVFENLKKMCLESSHLDSAKFFQLQD